MSEKGKHPMNRNTRLERGKPLRADPEKTKEWVRKSRRRLPAKSEQREEETPERQELVAMVKHEEPTCAAGIPMICTKWTTEVNEIIRRSQWKAGYLVRANTEGLCHNCHAFITAHPGKNGWAVRHGHQLMASARDAKLDLTLALTKYLRERLRGKCDADCTIDHREEKTS